MKGPIACALAVAWQLASSPSPAASTSFAGRIAPIFVKRCSVCHGGSAPQGGYRLDSYEKLMKPGAGGQPPIVPGRPSESLLFRLVSSDDPSTRMPKGGEPLTASELGAIESWIRRGASSEGLDPRAELASLVNLAFHPKPPDSYPIPVPILAVAADPQRRWLAASGYHEVNLWNTEAGTLLGRVGNLTERIQAIDCSPDGKILAFAGGTPGQQGEVSVWETSGAPAARPIATLPDVALDVRFSPDGKRLATAGADQVIRVFSVPDFKELRRIEQHADWVNAIAWSPDGSQLASASRDRTARVFSPDTGDLEATYTGHTAAVLTLAFSDDGKQVISAGKDRTVHVWEVDEAKRVAQIGGFQGDLLRLVVSGDLIITSCTDRIIRIHSLKEQKLRRSIGPLDDWAYGLAVLSSTHEVAIGSYDGKVRIAGLTEEQRIREFVAAPGRSSSPSPPLNKPRRKK